MKTTRYFDEQVLRKRPYSRIRFWGWIAAAGEARPRYLRVVTLEDGETVHNAFFDRNFREDEP